MTWQHSKLGPCLIVIPIANSGSGAVFYVDCCDSSHLRWIGTQQCKLVTLTSADKFKAPPALISLGYLGVQGRSCFPRFQQMPRGQMKKGPARQQAMVDERKGETPGPLFKKSFDGSQVETHGYCSLKSLQVQTCLSLTPVKPLEKGDLEVQ